MSAPHIAGLAALIMEANPNLEPSDVKTVIRETASTRGSPYNNDVSTKYNKNLKE